MPLLWLSPTEQATALTDAKLSGSNLPASVNAAFLCPVYMHSSMFGGRYSGGDVDDCLFSVLLPCGSFADEHWVTRSVCLLLTADPDLLIGMQLMK